jgi:ATP-dependent DNA helicase DinG
VSGGGRPTDGAAALGEAAAAALGEGGALAAAIPGFRPRSGQQALAAAVGDAVASRSVLVAEAGTGTGKTFAYLAALLLAGRRALVSTGTRHLQDRLHGRDIPAVRAALGVPVQVALLKGRANYVCLQRLEQHLQDGRFPDAVTPQRLRTIGQFAASSATGDRAECAALAEDDPAWTWATSTRENCLGQECPQARGCFVFRARREALAADLVVVNHHLLCADLALRDESLAELLPQAEVVVVDEAHALPDVATDFFGEAVSSRQCLELARDGLRAGLTEAADGARWREVAEALESAARDLWASLAEPAGVAAPGRASGGAPRTRVVRRWTSVQLAQRPALHAALARLHAALGALTAAVAANAGRGVELDRCGVRAGELLARVDRWRSTPAMGTDAAPTEPDGAIDDAVLWAESGPQHVTLRRTPLSVAEAFKRHRAGPRRAWVFVSATLSIGDDFGHFVEALGLDDAVCRRWESPFDFARQAALWVPRGLGPPSEAGFTERAIQAVWPLIALNGGRAFVLCTTLRAIRTVAQRLIALAAAERGRLDVLVQGDAPRPVLLERFRRSDAAVLVGSSGFWEGVDVAGDALSLVVIDKLPFAPPDDPVLEARAAALRRAGRDPFVNLHLPATALALKQGAGRLIRSETDRGVLVICDDRLLTRGYGRRLLDSLPPFARVAELAQAVAFLPPRTPGA